MHEKIDTDASGPNGPQGPAIADRGVPVLHRPFGCMEGNAEGYSEQIGSDPEARGNGIGPKIVGAFVYVFGSSSGPQKIGISGSPDMRLVDVRKMFPHLECIAFSKAFARGDAYRVEAKAHQSLRHVSRGNELFACTTQEAIDAVISAIDELGFTEVNGSEGGWNSKPTGVRIPRAMKDKIRELAAERRWTVSAYIEWVLEQHFEAMDAASKPPSSKKRS